MDEGVHGVSQELNFGRAALRLHLAQPAVTAQILSLEKDLGVKLFDRNSRGVRLTEAGEAFLEPCRAALQAIDAAALQARNSGTGEHGRLRIGFNVGFSIDPLVPLTRAVRSRYPLLSWEIDIPRLNTEIVRLVQTEELQLGLVGGPVTGDGLARHRVALGRLCVLVPGDHRLAGLSEVSMTTLRDEPFVLARSGPPPCAAWSSRPASAAASCPTGPPASRTSPGCWRWSPPASASVSPCPPPGC